MWKTGANCCAVLAIAVAVAASAQTTPPPLLDQAAIRSPLAAGCAGQADNAPLPVDPRSLVTASLMQAQAQQGTVVQFNAMWTDLHNPAPPFVYPAAPYSNNIPPRPTTCGAWRASVARGRSDLQSVQYFQVFGTALAYSSLWAVWGLPAPPADFDQQVMQRYGLAPAPFPNPYPLPGEDPALTKGGSGQLPLGLIQAKGPDGNYNGLIAVSCSACHDSRLGTPQEAAFSQGRSSDAFDAGLMVADMSKANGFTLPFLFAPIPWSAGRGGSDALGIIDYVGVMFNMDTLDLSPGFEYFPQHPAAGMTKPPNWWYRAFKVRQFWDGGLTSDNVRSEMAFGVANLFLTGAQRQALEPQFEDINNYLISLSPPQYPYPINTALAEQGAVIFHTRDLWANGANAGVLKPAGNGSCASCHGVYSPQYAADPLFLPDPRLKGVAAVVTPQATIDADPARYQLMELAPMRAAWASSWWGYREENAAFTGWNYDPLNTIDRVMADYGIGTIAPPGPNVWREPTGYIAPPLYGAWAAAPYLHNGSVPTIWSLLKSSDRPKIWQRQYTSAGSGFLPFSAYQNQGYDSSYESYDFANLGWKYTALACSNSAGTTPFLPCSNDMTTPDMFYASFQNAAAAYFSPAYQTPPVISPAQIRSRMIMNTYLYSLGNGGHEFTDALSDDERNAVIEYLKTL
jgi:exo-cleaving rubber dioxygenase